MLPSLLQEIEAGKVWKGTKAPAIGVDYWKLKPGADMRDLILAVRADEVGGHLGGEGWIGWACVGGGGCLLLGSVRTLYPVSIRVELRVVDTGRGDGRGRRLTPFDLAVQARGGWGG